MDVRLIVSQQLKRLLGCTSLQSQVGFFFPFFIVCESNPLKDLQSLKHQQEVLLENNKGNMAPYFIFWHFSLCVMCCVYLRGEVKCVQEKFSIKEYLGFTSRE